MKLIRGIFYIVWRCWFYGFVLFSIVAIFPILLIVTSSEKFYPIFFQIARAWAKSILFVMGFTVRIVEKPQLHKEQSFMFCPNHTSMIDVMVMLAITKNPFVFVGKKELANLPVFGFFYKRTCILVDRSDAKSRQSVFNEARRRMKDGLDICIFPEGLVPIDESIVLSPFKNGAFVLAIEHQIPIVPITFYDCKKRFSYTFFSGSPGDLRVKIHQPISTLSMQLNQKDQLKMKTFDLMYSELENDLKN